MQISEKYDIEWCAEYGEPGYSTNKTGIMFANWNEVKESTQKRLKKEFELEWSDEWIIDYNRNRAYRTSPDCWFWKPSILLLDGHTLSRDDAEEAPDEYIEYLTNNPNAANVFDVDLSKHGFSLIEKDFENGFYGIEDNPHKILEKLLEEHPNGEFIFSDFKPEQFRVCFSIWGRNI